MGKTTLLFHLLQRLRKTACTAFLFQTQCNSREFLRYLLADMGLESVGEDVVDWHAQLNHALVRVSRAGMRFVLVIDEAQNLADPVLETVRLLSDFETPGSKLMQIIIAGQPHLAAKLARPSLVQLRQRVAILSRLQPFSVIETDRYIDHRLQVAGYDGGRLFTSDARAMIAARSGGIPRNINNLCFNALSLGYALKRRSIEAEIVREVVADLNVESLAGNQPVPEPDSRPASVDLPLVPSSLVEKGSLGVRPFRIATLAALACLVSLLLFSPAGKPNRKAQLAPPSGPAALPQKPPRLVGALPALRAALGAPPAVTVEPGQTLTRICWRYLGPYSPKLIEEIVRLNPRITDPNHIEAGQRIVLPERTRTPTGAYSAGLPNGEPKTSARN
jgi:type II secretory pathway predicted ATPase ExeA/phage tail protein X